MSARSHNAEPAWVGFVRGAGGAALLTAIGLLIANVGNVHAGTLAAYVPLAVLTLRTAEAWVLDQRKPPPRRKRKPTT